MSIPSFAHDGAFVLSEFFIFLSTLWTLALLYYYLPLQWSAYSLMLIGRGVLMIGNLLAILMYSLVPI
jgi:hypothetical protein